jgi:hypothetical protein
MSAELESLLTKLKQDIQTEKQQHESKLAELQKQYDSVSLTLQLLREQINTGSDLSKSTSEVSIEQLRGKTHVEALKIIALANNGIVVTKTAKSLMLRAHLFKGRKHSGGGLYTTLDRADEFEKIDKGKFRLKEYTPESPTKPTITDLESLPQVSAAN